MTKTGWGFYLLPMVAIQVLLAGSARSLTIEGCPDGWLAHEHHCYRYIPGNLDVAGCSECELEGGILASVWNLEEWTFLKNNWPTLTGDPIYWLGLMRQFDFTYWSAGGWRWIDDSGNPSSAYWLSDGDKNAKPTRTQDCLAAGMAANGSFITFNCSDILDGYICKAARPHVYAMGTPWQQYSGGRPERWERQEDIIRSTYFHIVADPRPVLLYPDALSQVYAVDDVHCVNMCVAKADCVYVELICSTETKCGWFKCVMKAFV